MTVQVFQGLLDVGLVACLGVIAWKTLARYSVLVAGLMTVITATTANSILTETVDTILLTASLLLFARSYIGIFILFAITGAATVWIPRSSSCLPPFLRVLGQAASILVTLRTVELGALGTFVLDGLMEARYKAFPAVILLAVIGVRTLTVQVDAYRSGSRPETMPL